MRQLVYFILILGIGLSYVGNATGQEVFENLVMKPNWRQYSLNSKTLAISFPKHPTAHVRNDHCSDSDRYVYAAYAEDVVYSALVTSKARKLRSKAGCRPTVIFGPNLLESRIKEITDSGNYSRTDQIDKGGRKGVRLANEDTRILIFEDLKNNRFIELKITANKHRVIDEAIFFDSFSNSPNKDAVDVKGGSVATIGDDAQSTLDPLFWKDIEPEAVTYHLRLVHKIPARYTNAARYSNTQGTVVLRVTFMGSGSVGAVSVVSGLPNGLTENAILAARQMVFLPRKDKGNNVSVTRQVEYSFSMY